MRYCFLLLTLLAASVSAKFDLVVKDNDHPSYPLAKQVLSTHIDTLNQTYDFPFEVKVVLGVDDGPLFDPETNQVWFPFSFIDGINQAFDVAELYTENRDEAITGVLAHTLYHEAGHALVANLKLPILGMEENAVDTLATLLLITGDETGEGMKMALAAADAFNAEDHLDDSEYFAESQFYGSHALDAQRFYRGMCLIVGADPDNTEALVEELEWDEDKLSECYWEFEDKSSAMETLLSPYRKPNDA